MSLLCPCLFLQRFPDFILFLFLSFPCPYCVKGLFLSSSYPCLFMFIISLRSFPVNLLSLSLSFPVPVPGPSLYVHYTSLFISFSYPCIATGGIIMFSPKVLCGPWIPVLYCWRESCSVLAYLWPLLCFNPSHLSAMAGAALTQLLATSPFTACLLFLHLSAYYHLSAWYVTTGPGRACSQCGNRRSSAGKKVNYKRNDDNCSYIQEFTILYTKPQLRVNTH